MNLIRKAAAADHVTDATKILQEALHIEPSSLDDLYMTEQWRWARLETPSRIAHIRNWLDGQCYEVANCRPGLAPLDTVGTND